MFFYLALAGAIIAAAVEWEIVVFVPPSANKQILKRLKELGAKIKFCFENEESKHSGKDPCILEFQKFLLDENAIPFTVQGNENGLVIEGVQTMVFEILCQTKVAE